jgi:hypothetical protein
VLGHEDGHQEVTELPLPADTTGNKNAVQSWGSTISYGKRYVGLTLLGVATEDEDDDAKAAGALAAGGVITEDQVAELQKMVVSTNTKLPAFFRMLGVEKLEALPAAQFGMAQRFLQMKKEAQAQ